MKGNLVKITFLILALLALIVLCLRNKPSIHPDLNEQVPSDIVKNYLSLCRKSDFEAAKFYWTHKSVERFTEEGFIAFCEQWQEKEAKEVIVASATRNVRDLNNIIVFVELTAHEKSSYYDFDIELQDSRWKLHFGGHTAAIEDTPPF